MKPSQDIQPITYMKTHSAELVDGVTKKRRPLVITQHGEAKVVVQDVASYERDQETLLLLKLLSQGVADAELGHVTSHDSLFRHLEKKLAKMTT